MNNQRFTKINEQMNIINSFLVKLLWGQLNVAGLLDANHERTNETKLKPLYNKWLEESLAIIQRNYSIIDKSTHIDETWKEWERHKAAWLENQNLKAQVILVEETLRVLPNIITGRLLATDVLFPKGSMSLVEGIYKHNEVADCFNEILSDSVMQHLQNLIHNDPNVQIRILEIGAGTGGTSAMLLSKLKSYSRYIQEYCYTDISKAFLKYGESQYGRDYPFLTFEVLNIEESIERQGIDIGGYDLIIAANVLHATRNIRQTLRNAKALIKPSGSILINEITDSSIFTHLTFGLLEGWWKYEDAGVRIPGCPGLYPDQWKRSLEIEGFYKVSFPAKEFVELGQQIIMAQSDGIVNLHRGVGVRQHEGLERRKVASGQHSSIEVEKTVPMRAPILKIEDHVKNVVLEILSDYLRVQSHMIHSDDSFFDYGVDSIVGMRLVQAINKSLNIELDSTDLFDYTSVNLLTKYITDTYNDVLFSEPSQDIKPINQSNVSAGLSLDSQLKGRTAESRVIVERSSGPVGEKSIGNVKDYIMNSIVENLCDLLKLRVDSVHTDDPFSDYGVDSITGLHFIERLNKTLGINLETTDLFDYSSVEQLSAYIYSEYKSELIQKIPQNNAEQPNNDSQNSNIRADFAITKQEMNDIAIIGMSGRFANSNNVNELWEHLKKGSDLVHEVKRWDLTKYHDQETEFCNYGSFLDDIDRFDPLFFNITGLEATYMDPQQRIILEESWKALEDAGYAGNTIQGKSCGVYVGCGPSDYEKLIGNEPPAQAFWGNASSIIPARIAYYLDLQGPAIAVDTACSSSLVAIHLACQGLQANETEMALAGGVFLQATPNFYLYSQRAGMLSSTGRCHTFDDKADGFVPGEGAGVIVLKRLTDAVRDGDHIHGVIKGMAVNQDGFTNGITAPSARSQERLEHLVYDKFGIHPENIQMVEAHGTGTKLGDPIEFKALTRAFSKYTDKKNYCAMGTIKTNIGHTQYAAGIAGLIKVLLSLKHKQMVPSLHYEQKNKNMDIANSPFYINTRLQAWEAPTNGKRTAAVSSFGFSGTNAHMVVEEAPGLKRKYEPKPGYLFALSARTEEELYQVVRRFIEHCQKDSQIDCGNLCHTLLVGRRHLNYRIAGVIRNIEELVSYLDKWLKTGSVPQLFQSMHSENIQNDELLQYGNACIQKITNDYCEEGTYIEKLTTVANMFTQGYKLDFNKLFANDMYSRISLPTYPFGKNKYWVSGADIKSVPNVSSKSSNSVIEESSLTEEKRKFSFATKKWIPASIEATKKQVENIAILTSNETRALAEKLCIYFPGAYILDIHDLESDIEQPVHFWRRYSGCIDLIGCGTIEGLEIDWISWIQRLIEYGNREDLMLLCVTRDLEPYQNPSINMSGAARVGLFRTLQSEYSYVRSRHMDGEFSEGEAAFAEQIAKEFLSDTEETEICYRNKKRYLAYLDETEVLELDAPPRAFPKQHVLWITGGTKGLGLLCAKHFVKHYGVKKLVLSGREVLPPREEWDSYIAKNSSNAQKLKSIQALEEMGAEVFVSSVDLTDVQAMRATIEGVKRFMGPIGGVIHCAGLADLENVAFIRKSPDVIGKVLNPKIHGLEVMYQSFTGEPLHFFVLYSSVSAIIPTLGAGISDYAMGNAYMDYFSESKSKSCPMVSIQWSSWRETGIGEVKSNAYKQTGMLSMTNEEGLQMLDYILAQRCFSVVLPALVDSRVWDTKKLMKRRITEAELGPVSQSIPENIGANTHDTSTTDDDLMEQTQKWLISLFSKELRIDSSEFTPDKTFQQYGMDSILLAQVITRMDSELKGIALDPSVLLEYPTLKSLTVYLVDHFAEILKAVFFNEIGIETKAKKVENLTSGIKQADIENKASSTRSIHDKIAIVGIDCQFPDARNASEYWDNLRNGKDSIRKAPTERWKVFNQYKINNQVVEKEGGYLDQIDQFDPEYFQISESLATQMDPLQRKVLECGAGAISDAGYSKPDLWNKQVGVFIGARTSKYFEKLQGSDRDTIIGIGQNFIAAHLSHIYNFKGPNMIVDTACSSSLTAIHMAVKSIQYGECEMAIAGGVDIILDETIYDLLSSANIYSVDGRSKAFSAEANGIGVGEGCGIVILKPLEEAIRDNNKIYGVIDGSAINNDGNTMGITTPNPEAQKELIEKAIIDAQIHPDSISYLETHGTGTLIGDPIELKALTDVFSRYTFKKQYCGVGSVKSNIGHLICAAGIASFIKVLLAMTHRELPATLHCHYPNPRFNFNESPFYIVNQPKAWSSENHVLRAGINSFGLGGSNAHVIVSNEGIPYTHQASLHSNSQAITFNRKRYWPESQGGSAGSVQTPEQEDMIAFFESVEVD